MTARAEQPRPASPAATFPLSYGIFRLARIHRAYAAQLLRALELHPGQELILMALHANGPQRQAQLVEIEHIDHSTVAKSLRRMERAGLVRRKQSSEDRRVTIVSLSAKGQTMHKKIQAAWAQLERVSVASLDAEERQQLVNTMRSVEDAIANQI